MNKRTWSSPLTEGKTPALYLLLVLLAIVFVPFFAGCSQVNGQQIIDENNNLGFTVEPTETVELTPTLTSTPTQKPTQTLVPTSTQTSVPKELEPWMCEVFMFGGGDYPVENLALYGWVNYDGVEFLDDYPCYLNCPFEQSEARNMITNACNEGITLEFLCEWTCGAVYNGFGPRLKTRPIDNYYLMHVLYGDPSKELYCPQFATSLETGPGFDYYKDFNCNVEQPTPTSIPQLSLDWPEDMRKSIEDNYLWTILNDNFRLGPGFNKNSDWTLGEVNSLTDTEVCWIIANGHFLYGFPEYLPEDIERDNYKQYEMRMKLRDKLNVALGEPVDGNPPLCPGFLDMIDNVWIH